MNRIKEVIHEIHRRSLWQVLGIFLASSWGVLQGVEFVTDFAGLPDWTPAMALVLLMIGLPICLATAFVQEGMPGRDGAHGAEGLTIDAPAPNEAVQAAAATTERATAGRPGLLTWKNAILGGIGAFALLGFSLIAYFVMWSTGIGPVGNLQAQGLIDEGDPVLLADFANTTSDASLGTIVTEALRVDLASTQTITLVEPGTVSSLLGMMGQPEDTPVRGRIADDLAARGGARAIIEGEVGAAGAGYILVATIRASQGGATLATFRRTAQNDGEVIAAIDGLSQDIRERAGESLRSIRAEEPLEAVTTPSLEALTLFTEAQRVRDTGDGVRARALLEQALEADPEFAMAWRGLSVVLLETGGSRAEVQDAARRAYELRDRLTDRERYGTVAHYHREVTGDLLQEIASYETLLEAYPDDQAGLNNLAIGYSDLGRWEDAAALIERAITGPGANFSNYVNMPLYASLGGDFERAAAAHEEVVARFPEDGTWRNWTGFIQSWTAWDTEDARRWGSALQTEADAVTWRRTGTRTIALTYAISGEAAAAAEAFEGARGEARRADDADAQLDLVTTWMDEARSELLVGSGDPTGPLGDLLASGAIGDVPPLLRDNFRWILDLAWAGYVDEARTLFDEWEAAGSDVQGRMIQDVGRVLDAYELGHTDPAAGAAALVQWRNGVGCARCYLWEVGTLYERAGMIDEAIAEREASTEAGQDFWFGMHRLAALESLGRLYEQRGDTARAVDQYRAYTEQLSGGSGLPRVEHARARLAALQSGA